MVWTLGLYYLQRNKSQSRCKSGSVYNSHFSDDASIFLFEIKRNTFRVQSKCGQRVILQLSVHISEHFVREHLSRWESLPIQACVHFLINICWFWRATLLSSFTVWSLIWDHGIAYIQMMRRRSKGKGEEVRWLLLQQISEDEGFLLKVEAKTAWQLFSFSLPPSCLQHHCLSACPQLWDLHVILRMHRLYLGSLPNYN